MANPTTLGPLDALLDELADRVAARLLARLEPSMRQPPALPTPTGLVDRRTAARAVGVSLSTLDRFVLEGAPLHRVGARRRFDIAELRTWLEARGKRPARVVPSTPRDDVDDDEIREIASAGGLRAH